MVEFRSVEVVTNGGASDGRLAMADGKLVAVLVHVEPHETAGGHTPPEGWFLEAGFGPCSALMTEEPDVFETLEHAADWITQRLD